MFHHTVLVTIFDKAAVGGMRTQVVASFPETLAEHIANGDEIRCVARKAATVIFEAQHEQIVERLKPHRTNFHYDLFEGNQLIVRKNVYSQISGSDNLVAVLQYNVHNEGVDG